MRGDDAVRSTKRYLMFDGRKYFTELRIHDRLTALVEPQTVASVLQRSLFLRMLDTEGCPKVRSYQSMDHIQPTVSLSRVSYRKASSTSITSSSVSAIRVLPTK